MGRNRREGRGPSALTVILVIFLILSCVFDGILCYGSWSYRQEINDDLKEQESELADLKQRISQLETAAPDSAKSSGSGSETSSSQSAAPSSSAADAASDTKSVSESPASAASSTGNTDTVTEAKLNIDDLDAGSVLSETVYAEQYAGNVDDYFKSYEISEGDEVYNRIYGKSYVENDTIGYWNLRYLKMLHYNFNGQLQVGEMIVNSEISDTVLTIFKQLYEYQYPIYSMYLIDNFWTGDGPTTDDASCRANNTSCFCYRVTTGGSTLSNHATGKAIDINPLQNPYVTVNEDDGSRYVDDPNAQIYADTDYRSQHPDICINDGDFITGLFYSYGFTWLGTYYPVIDYQHFEIE